MRGATAIVLPDETRLRLEKRSRGRSTPVRIVQHKSDCCSGRGPSSEQADCRADGGCASDGGFVARPFPDPGRRWAFTVKIAVHP
jgi:hypothetical protein